MNAEALKTYAFTHEGKQFIARLYRDEDMGAPWVEHDGHGIIRELKRTQHKTPGERPMGNGYQYDVPATIELAKRDAWGLSDEACAALASALKRAPTAAEVTAEAVRLDFEHCRRWVRDEWHWCGVSVVAVPVHGEVPDEHYTDALWGFESEGDYWKEVAREIASGMEGG